jgi:DNA ligase-1
MLSVNQILELVAATPSKNAKIAILTKHKDNKVLQEVIRLTYDPTVNFYIKQIPVARKFDEAVSLSGALIRIKNIAAREYTGNAAREYLFNILQSVTEADAKVIAKIIGRDLRAGFGKSTANKVWKNLIPEFPYMRCSV